MTGLKRAMSVLVVVAFFGSIIPIVAAHDANTLSNPTSSPDIFVSQAGVVTSGPATFEGKYDITVNLTTIVANAGEDIDLKTPSGTLVSTQKTYWSNHTGPNHNSVLVTFPGVTTGVVGSWLVDAPGATDVTFDVGAKSGLSVSISPNNVDFERKTSWYAITVTRDGSPVNNASIWIQSLGASGFKTSPGSDGVYNMLVNLSAIGAGTHAINAYQSTAGNDVPTLTGNTVTNAELSGTTNLVVNGGSLTLAKRSGSAIVNFDGAIEISVFYPSTSVGALADVPVGTINVTLTVWNGTKVYYLLGAGNLGGAGVQPMWKNAVTADFAGTLALQNDGDLLYTPLASNSAFHYWKSGQYTFDVAADKYGSSSAEYTGSFSITPTQPKSVNVGITPLAGKIPAPTPSNAAPTAAGVVSVALTIEGNTFGSHPGNLGLPFSASNISVAGDLLTGSAVITMGATQKDWTIAFSPTKGKGVVTISVTWRGATETIQWKATDTPGTGTPSTGGPGSVLTVDKNELTVDQQSFVTFTLTTPAGTPAGVGTVVLYEAGVGPIATIGGNPDVEGRGKDGKFTFNITPTQAPGTRLYAVGYYGSSPHFNYSYATVSVLAARDLTTTSTVASTLAGSVTTFNASTMRNGAFPSGATYNVYMLNHPEYVNFSATNADQTAIKAAVGANYKWTGVGANITSQTFTARNPTANGPYHIYVETTDGKHSNFGAEPTIAVNKANVASTPNRIVSGTVLGGPQNIVFNVTGANGAGLTGTLTFVGANATFANGTSSGGTSITITNGVGNATFKGVTVGTLAAQFTPTSGTAEAAVSDLAVVGPNVDITPKTAVVGKPVTAQISIFDKDGAVFAKTVKVQLCGAPITSGIQQGGVSCTAQVDTAAGKATVSFVPQVNGEIVLWVNGLVTEAKMQITSGILIRVTPQVLEANNSVSFEVLSEGPLSGANISISGPESSTVTTGTDGTVTYTPMKAGTYTASVTHNGATDSTTFTVLKAPEEEKPVGEAKFELTEASVNPSEITLGDSVQAIAKVTNTGDAAGSAEVELIVNGNTVKVFMTSTLQPGASQSRQESFTPPTAGTYEIQLRVNGGTPSETVTLKVNAKAAPPTSEPTKEPTKEPTTTEPAPQTGTPGFGVFALFAALGAALVLLRRKD